MLYISQEKHRHRYCERHVEDLPEKSCWNGIKKCFQRNNYLEDVQTFYIFPRKNIVITSFRLIWEAQMTFQSPLVNSTLLSTMLCYSAVWLVI